MGASRVLFGRTLCIVGCRRGDICRLGGPFYALPQELSVVPEPPVWAEAHNNWQMHPGKYFVIDIRNRARSYPFSHPVKIIAVAWGPAEH